LPNGTTIYFSGDQDKDGNPIWLIEGRLRAVPSHTMPEGVVIGRSRFIDIQSGQRREIAGYAFKSIDKKLKTYNGIPIVFAAKKSILSGDENLNKDGQYVVKFEQGYGMADIDEIFSYAHGEKINFYIKW